MTKRTNRSCISAALKGCGQNRVGKLTLASENEQNSTSRSRDLARNFLTSPNGIPRHGDVTTFRTKSS